MGAANSESTKATRANGRASRRQILDAAADLAREHGYHGTSIASVSKRSGLPASSIYWHFENKEDLLTDVIDDSYARWRDELGEPHGASNPGEGKMFERLYASLRGFPDFVRLGLMVTLERAPQAEQSARRRFLQIRQESLDRLAGALAGEYPDLDATQVGSLAAITLALVDGSFVAAVAGEPAQDPRVLSDAVHAVAAAMGAGHRSAGQRSAGRRRP